MVCLLHALSPLAFIIPINIILFVLLGRVFTLFKSIKYNTMLLGFDLLDSLFRIFTDGCPHAKAIVLVTFLLLIGRLW